MRSSVVGQRVALTHFPARSKFNSPFCCFVLHVWPQSVLRTWKLCVPHLSYLVHYIGTPCIIAYLKLLEIPLGGRPWSSSLMQVQCTRYVGRHFALTKSVKKLLFFCVWYISETHYEQMALPVLHCGTTEELRIKLKKLRNGRHIGFLSSAVGATQSLDRDKLHQLFFSNSIKVQSGPCLEFFPSLFFCSF